MEKSRTFFHLREFNIIIFTFIVFFLPSRFLELPYWTSWSEEGTVSPWLRFPKRGFPGSTSPQRIHSRGYRIPRTSTCKSPGLIRVKKKKCKKERWSRYSRQQLLGFKEDIKDGFELRHGNGEASFLFLFFSSYESQYHDIFLLMRRYIAFI